LLSDALARQRRIEEAIVIVQKAASLITSSPNERVVSSWLKSQRGDLEVHGWQGAERDEITLVSCTISRGGITSGFYFEVYPELALVRNINGDAELEKKYGVSPDPRIRQYLKYYTGDGSNPYA